MTHDALGDFLREYSRLEQAVETALERHSAAAYRYSVRYAKLERLRRTLDENGLADRFDQIAADDLAELRSSENAEAAEWRAYTRAKAKLEEADNAMSNARTGWY